MAYTEEQRKSALKRAKAQYEMCQKLGIKITDTPVLNDRSLILDCIYGTGFHGELPEAVKQLLDKVNKTSAIKVACDIPSGLYFQADYTITMGCQPNDGRYLAIPLNLLDAIPVS